MPITPLSNRVLLEVQEHAEKTASGIFIPDAAQEKPYQGIILAIGPEVTQVKAGNRVLFSKYGGSDVKVDDQPIKIISEKDILAIIED